MNEKIFTATMQLLKSIQNEYNNTTKSYDHDINVQFGSYANIITYDDIQIDIKFTEK